MVLFLFWVDLFQMFLHISFCSHCVALNVMTFVTFDGADDSGAVTTDDGLQ